MGISSFQEPTGITNTRMNLKIFKKSNKSDPLIHKLFQFHYFDLLKFHSNCYHNKLS